MYHIVYLTTNKVNLKIYVGVHSTYNLDDGYIGSGLNMQRARRKYGFKNFERTILFYCLSSKDAYELEKKIVDVPFLLRRDTYNIGPGGQGGDFSTGKSMSEKTKLKLSLARKGIKRKKETIDKIIKANTGKTRTQETKQKMSESAKNKPAVSEETKQKMSLSSTGKIHSEETKTKISLAIKGKQKSRANDIMCEYCNKLVMPYHYDKWHGENCKNKI